MPKLSAAPTAPPPPPACTRPPTLASKSTAIPAGPFWHAKTKGHGQFRRASILEAKTRGPPHSRENFSRGKLGKPPPPVAARIDFAPLSSPAGRSHRPFAVRGDSRRPTALQQTLSIWSAEVSANPPNIPKSTASVGFPLADANAKAAEGHSPAGPSHAAPRRAAGTGRV